MTSDILADAIQGQIEMNRETWRALVENGVTRTTPIRLEFAYIAPTLEAAETLAAFLRQETDYDVRMSHASEYWVEGATRHTQVDLSVLDEWVEWMVVAGFENGGSVFDGWGVNLG